MESAMVSGTCLCQKFQMTVSRKPNFSGSFTSSPTKTSRASALRQRQPPVTTKGDESQRGAMRFPVWDLTCLEGILMVEMLATLRGEPVPAHKESIPCTNGCPTISFSL